MTDVTLTWWWTTRSPLHVGSGLSRADTADRAVQRDRLRRPYIPGDAIKGALRMSMEQYLSWLGLRVATTAAHEPTGRLLRAILRDGMPVAGRFVDGVGSCELVDEKKIPTAAVASTAIDCDTGVAEEKTLRVTEVVAENLVVRSSFSVPARAADQRLISTLLLGALAATESIGADAGIGRGRVELARVELAHDGKLVGVAGDLSTEVSKCRVELADGAPVVDLSAFVGAESLKELSQAIAENAVDRATDVAAERQSPERKHQWYRLEIEVEEPFTIGDRPLVGNTTETLDHVPGSTLKGALQSAWIREGSTRAEIDSWLGASTRWTPAFPVSAPDGSRPYVPAPASFVAGKDVDLAARNAVHDRLLGPPRWETTLSRRLRDAWLCIEEGKAPKPKSSGSILPRETRMHVARDYVTGSKREGALYARAEVAALPDRPVRLVAWARVPVGVEWPGEHVLLRIGKRASAGSGRAALRRVTPVESPWDSLPKLDEGSRSGSANEVRVQLLSPALLIGEDGFPLLSLGAAEWSTLTRCEVHQVDAWSATRVVHGWATRWSHGRTPERAIDGGSIWRLTCATADRARTLRKRLGELEKAGIGSRTEDGFGCLLVDPPWLSVVAATADPKVEIAPPTTQARPRAWPGVPLDRSPDLVEVVRMIRDRVDFRDPALRIPVRELLGRYRTANETPSAAIEFFDERAGRKNPGNWDRQKVTALEALRTFLGDLLERGEASELLFGFALEALNIGLESEDPA